MGRKVLLAAAVFVGLLALNTGVMWLRGSGGWDGVVAGAVGGTVMLAWVTRLER